MKSPPPIPSCSNENICFHVGDYSFGFNGKDKESEFNSGAYDFGARIHDARLGRWMSVDAFATKYPGTSSYSFCWNNPNIFIDPTGNDGRLIIDYEKKQITLETTVFLHGNLSCEEMQEICDTWNAAFNAMDHSSIIRDPNNQASTWTVTFNVDFKFDEILNQTCEKMGFNEGRVTDNSMESIENAEAYGIMPGDNLLRIREQSGNQAGYTGLGINEGLSSSSFTTGIHEVGHMLGFDERYNAYKIENGVKIMNPTPFSVFCFGLGDDFMSNNPLSAHTDPVISTFHYVDVLTYVLNNNPSLKTELVVGTVKKTLEITTENPDGSQTIQSKKTTIVHQFDDTNSGAGNVCEGIEEKNNLEVKQ